MPKLLNDIKFLKLNSQKAFLKTLNTIKFHQKISITPLYLTISILLYLPHREKNSIHYNIREIQYLKIKNKYSTLNWYLLNIEWLFLNQFPDYSLLSKIYKYNFTFTYHTHNHINAHKLQKVINTIIRKLGKYINHSYKIPIYHQFYNIP